MSGGELRACATGAGATRWSFLLRVVRLPAGTGVPQLDGPVGTAADALFAVGDERHAAPLAGLDLLAWSDFGLYLCRGVGSPPLSVVPQTRNRAEIVATQVAKPLVFKERPPECGSLAVWGSSDIASELAGYGRSNTYGALLDAAVGLTSNSASDRRMLNVRRRFQGRSRGVVVRSGFD